MRVDANHEFASLLSAALTRRMRHFRPTPLITALTLAFALPGHAAGLLPTSGHFVAGSGAIDANGTTVTISQGSSRGVIDWNSFSIGKGNRVTFDNGRGATLNRVTGGNPSVIMGSLTATGSVYLINPQGVVISPSGVVATAGRFVASTLESDPSSFMKGGDLRFTGSSKARIVNLGKIGSSQGDVLLIAADEIDNLGTLSASRGTVELSVGKQLLLRDSANGRQVTVLVGSGGSVINRGVIEAAQVSLQAVDGNVFALSGKHEAIRATGTATRDGHVWLVAGRGLVRLGGRIEATNSADGAGGSVDTSAAYLAFCPNTPAVLAGIWNIMTPSLTIGRSMGQVFSRSLSGGTSVNLQTTGEYNRTGDINVAANINWSGDASLTLAAYRSVNVDHDVTLKNAGRGDLTLRADATGIDNSGSVLNKGTVDWSKSRGIVSLLYDMNGSYSPGTLLGDGAWTSPLYSGLVTQITGYKLVNSSSDLANIQADLAGNYAVGRDFGTMGSFAKPLAATDSSRPFTGQFDGMWHTISDLGAPLFQDTSGVVRDVYLSPGFVWNSNDVAAGVVAVNNSGTITHVSTFGSMWDPDATFGDSSSFAGLVGTNTGFIARSGSQVSIWVGGNAGGLAVDNQGTIVESYATGPMTQIAFGGAAGGLVAFNSGTISRSYASGAVSGTQVLGGICGFCSSGTNGLTDDYWNVDTTGQGSIGFNASSPNGLSSAQMSNPVNFVGWDFGPNGGWAMPAGAAQPVLRWQLDHPGPAASSL